jgi:hypothetical protein
VYRIDANSGQQWQNGRRGQDGWGRWTRRRKWYRDAELVEIEDGEPEPEPSPESEQTPLAKPPRPVPAPMSPQSAAQYNTIDEKMISPIRSEHGVSDSTDPSSSDTRDSSSAGHGTNPSGDDNASLLSTSSQKSTAMSFFKTPALRRRTAVGGAGGSASGGGAGASGVSSTGTVSVGTQERGRRSSEARSEEDAAALGLQVELELQGHGKEVGSWGIGDEARMSLE